MEAIIYLIGSTTLFVVGFYLGMEQGVKKGQDIGFNRGVSIAMQIIDRHMRQGLTTALDWKTAQKLLNEKMGKN